MTTTGITTTRVLLRQHDVAGGVDIGLIDLAVRYALDHGILADLADLAGAPRTGGSAKVSA